MTWRPCACLPTRHFNQEAAASPSGTGSSPGERPAAIRDNDELRCLARDIALAAGRAHC